MALQPTPTPQPLPHALQHSANESAVFGLAMYRADLPALGPAEGTLLLDALLDTEADLCRLNLPAEATHALATLWDLQLPHGLFGVFQRCVLRLQPTPPEFRPERPGNRFVPFTEPDTPLVRQMIYQISPDTVDFNFTDPLLRHIIPPHKRLQTLADYLCTYAYHPDHPERYGVFFMVNDTPAGYGTFNIYTDTVQGLVGGTLPPYRGLGLMEDVFHHMGRQCLAWGPQYSHIWGDVHIQNRPQFKALARAHMHPAQTFMTLSITPMFGRSLTPVQHLPYTSPLAQDLWPQAQDAALALLANQTDTPHWQLQQLTSRNISNINHTGKSGPIGQYSKPRHIALTVPILEPSTHYALVVLRAYNAQGHLLSYAHAHLQQGTGA